MHVPLWYMPLHTRLYSLWQWYGLCYHTGIEYCVQTGIYLLYTPIWNPIHLDRIWQNCMYWYVPVHTGTYQYMPVQELYNGMYQYILILETGHWDFSYTQAAPRELIATAYSSHARDMMGWCQISKKWKIQAMQVHPGTYWYVLVSTGMYQY